MATAAEVAAWMLAEFERARFGPEFVAGGGIRKAVRAAFRQGAQDRAIWVPSRQAWRRRNADDPPFRARVRGQ